MHRIGQLALLLTGIVSTAAVSTADSTDKVRALATTELAALGRDPIVVAAVKAQNDVGRTLDDVKALDAKWQATAGVADFMRALMDSPPGRHLASWKQAHPYVSEVFVMDKLGANVAQTDKTSDYWQGDEAKFLQSRDLQPGQLLIEGVRYDDSSQRFLAQLHAPLFDAEGVRLGTLTFGMDIEAVFAAAGP